MGQLSYLATGEPWIVYFDPPALAQELRQLSFRHLADLEPEQANQRYFKDRPIARAVGADRVGARRVCDAESDAAASDLGWPAATVEA